MSSDRFSNIPMAAHVDFHPTKIPSILYRLPSMRTDTQVFLWLPRWAFQFFKLPGIPMISIYFFRSPCMPMAAQVGFPSLQVPAIPLDSRVFL